MFTQEELDNLAKQAKERIKNQSTENQEGNVNLDEDVDIYAEFRDELDECESEYISNNYSSDTSQSEEEYNAQSFKDIKEVDVSSALDDNDYDDDDINYTPPKIEDYDDLLFPGGPTKNQLEIWRKQYENYDIYVIEVLGEYFIFRTLDRIEYKQLTAMNNIDALAREEVICERVTLWPVGYDYKAMARGKAGIPSTYAQAIMERSGFTTDFHIEVI